MTGRCVNGTDLVDPDPAPTFVGMLGFGDGSSLGGANEDAEANEGFQGDSSAGAAIPIGSLHLSNNSVNASLDPFDAIGF